MKDVGCPSRVASASSVDEVAHLSTSTTPMCSAASASSSLPKDTGTPVSCKSRLDTGLESYESETNYTQRAGRLD